MNVDSSLIFMLLNRRATFPFAFLSFAILFLSAPMFGQILRVDKGVSVSDSSGFYTGHIGMDLSMNNRNSTADEEITFTSIRGNGDLGYTAEKHVYYIITDVRYFQSTGGPLLSTGYGHLRANFWRKKRLSYEAFSQAQYDQGRGLDRRFLAGAGIRYKIMEKLVIGTGFMQESEIWESSSANNGVIEKNLFKSTSYLTGKVQISAPVSLSLTGYFQTGYDDDIEQFRNRVSGDVSFNIKMGKKLSFRMRYTHTYEERPIIPLSKSVYVLGSGVKYSF